MHQRSAVTSEGHSHDSSTSTAHLVATLRAHNQLLSARRVEDRTTIHRLERENLELRQRLEARREKA